MMTVLTVGYGDHDGITASYSDGDAIFVTIFVSVLVSLCLLSPASFVPFMVR